MTSFYPLRFLPQYHYRLWGGGRLRTVLGKEYQGQKRGESWEISSVSGYESTVAEGDLKGQTLTTLLETYPTEILGQQVVERFGTAFPLLIKFIDTDMPLSVQVHPNDALAQKRHRSFGKNEMWYVLHAEPNAELIIGFTNGVDLKHYEEKLHSQRLEDILHRQPVRAGDVVYIPAGIIHAIGGGILLAEIQQSSDVTYRVYDYNRVDVQSGAKRELHTDLAKEAIDFSAKQQRPIAYSKTPNRAHQIIHTPYFNTNFIAVDGLFSRDLSATDSFHIYICLEGAVTLQHVQKEYSLKKGETLLVPACIPAIDVGGEGKLLEVYV